VKDASNKTIKLHSGEFTTQSTMAVWRNGGNGGKFSAISATSVTSAMLRD
jgi:hypothetical protein